MPVHKKINEARIAFHALPLKKSGHNTFAGYKYFELSDFVIPALRIFNDVGLCAVISFSETTATMHIVDVEDGTQVIIHSPMGSANLKGCHEIQNIGACETYSTRYLWTAALCIVEHDALDATTGKSEPAPRENYISGEQFSELFDLVHITKTDMALLCKHYKINALNELQETRFNAVKAALEKKLK
jgi:ERF superfamily